MVVQRYVGIEDNATSATTTQAAMFNSVTYKPVDRSGILVYNSHASQNWFCRIDEQGAIIPTMTTAGVNAMYKVAPGETKFIPARKNQIVTEIGSNTGTTRTAHQVQLVQVPEGRS